MILRWLLPLGFLGALGIVVLLVLYLLKPQYKVRKVSATLVWKQVLLRRKRQSPMLSHIFLFLLQAALLTLMALALAEPHLFSPNVLLENTEYVVILDASASMRARAAGTSEKTRFERAKEAATEKIRDLFGEGDGSVSVILAGSRPEYLINGYGRSRSEEIYGAIGAAQCSEVAADLEAAVGLARAQLEVNPYAKIFLYTDTAFGDTGTALSVVDVSDRTKEWNIAILGCDVAFRDNEYLFGIRLGAYGDVAVERTLRMEIRGADNGNGVRNYELNVPVRFEPKSPSYEAVQTVSVRATDAQYGGGEDWFFESFEEVRLELPDLGDSLPDDDVYYVYGGMRDRVSVEYWSASPNSFWQLGVQTLASDLSSRRRISFREIYSDAGETVGNEGYDLYIFEHAVPPEILAAGMPKDGVIVLADPDESVQETVLGLSVGERVSIELQGCEAPTAHPLLRYNDPAEIRLTQYSRVTADESFLPILYCNGDPVMFVKDGGDARIVVLAFSINMSDFYGREFMIFLYDLLETFMPVTLNGYDFTVGESVQVNCKGVSVEVAPQGAALEEFPAEYVFTGTGTYTFTTRFGLDKPDEVRMAYVHGDLAESALFRDSAFTVRLDNRELTGDAGKDLFPWFAAAVILLLLAEWYLQFKDIV